MTPALPRLHPRASRPYGSLTIRLRLGEHTFVQDQLPSLAAFFAADPRRAGPRDVEYGGLWLDGRLRRPRPLRFSRMMITPRRANGCRQNCSIGDSLTAEPSSELSTADRPGEADKVRSQQSALLRQSDRVTTPNPRALAIPGNDAQFPHVSDCLAR